jgi:hypothetical protein
MSERNTPPGSDPGTRYGYLVVMRIAGESAHRRPLVECRCDCGEMHVAWLSNLRTAIRIGRKPRCKTCNLKRNSEAGLHVFRPEDYLAKRFGRLLVTGLDVNPERRRRKSHLVCICDCGTQVVVEPASLTKGNSTSCGCKNSERFTEYGLAKRSHGHSALPTVDHPLRCSPTYLSWMKVMECVRSGIERGAHKACHEHDERWNVFENFLADFGVVQNGELVRRIDNKVAWCKENCYIGRGRIRVPRGREIADEDLNSRAAT